MTSKLGFGYSFVLACVLALLAGPALALGLGRIEVLSQPGQPLLAEIPIISTDPAELEHLQARLAAPETFRRVGLQPPDMEVSGLQFAVALDRGGRPVIRVTSQAPLRQPLLTFLLEVDWGQGRLVREYSALLDAPNTVAATAQPIQAPVLAPSNRIVRAPQVTAAPVPANVPMAPPSPVPPAPQPRPAVATPTFADIPMAPPPPVPPPPRPAAAAIAARPPPAPPAPVAPPAPAATPAPPRADARVVQRGDTLSEIAASLDRRYSIDQTMLALLHANPDAFIDDNINLLKQGAVLRTPRADEFSRYSAGEAAAVVRTQVAQWRQTRAPQPQPAAVAQAAAPSAAADSTDATAGNTDARLKIVPTSSGRGQQAGTRSGIQAGGEGDMLRQELQETLAARDAEVGELKTRVAELERLQQQQQQLIAMKDSALAAAQQNLAKANAAVPMTQAATQQPAAPPPADTTGAGLWLWGGVALLVLALLGWLLSRRRGQPAAQLRGFDTAALAAGMPGASAAVAAPLPEQGMDEAGAVDYDDLAEDDLIEDGRAEDELGEDPDEDELGEDLDEDELQAATLASDDSAPASVATPHWTAAPALVGTVPTWHGAESTAVAAVPNTRSPGEQLELARAYLDLGDDDSARTLLREVLDGRDPAARETAARMLRDL